MTSQNPGRANPMRSAIRWGGIVLVLLFLLLLASCGVGMVGSVIQPGDIGVKIKTLGTAAGVDPRPYPSGWNFKGLGEHFVEYPVIERTYTYTREKDARGPENEEITFADNNALSMTADVQLVLQVNPAAAPALYKRWRLSFDDLLDTPIRNDVRTAIAAEAEKVPVQFLYQGGRQEVIRKALTRIQAKWEPQGVHISQLDWIGPIRYPEVITQSIQATTKANADRVAAEAKVAVATANADAQIATAKGEAESIRLRGEALRSSPEVVQQIYAQRSAGLCPPGTKTCIIGAGAWGLVPGAQDDK